MIHATIIFLVEIVIVLGLMVASMGGGFDDGQGA